jgi:hypothetical protein
MAVAIARTYYAMRHPGAAAVPSGLDVLAGIWLLLSPFVLAFHNAQTAGADGTAATANNVILGIVIGILARYRAFNPTRSPEVSWVNALLGVWVLVSPWVVGFAGVHNAALNNVIVGIAVIILSLWSGFATTSGERAGTGREFER